MSDSVPRLMLASASPRRADYLRMLGLDFVVDPAHIDEAYVDGETPREHVERLAREKAEAMAPAHPESLILGGDTVVLLDGRVLGKPGNAAEAEAMLLALSGRSHEVLSGLALRTPGGRVVSGVDRTEVRFRPLDPAAARAYVATGEPMDKAGAYGIQGLGASLVEAVDGDYYTVVGLPVALLMRLLGEAGLRYHFGDLIPVAEAGS